MAVTTTYGFKHVKNITPGSDLDPDVVGLMGGGFAIAADHSTHVDVDIYDQAGDFITGFTTPTGQSEPSVAQLTNGNLVIVTQDADSINYEIRALDGSVVVADTDIGDTGPSTDPEVVALASGGFAIVNADVVGDNEVDLRVYNANGVFQFASQNISGGASGAEYEPVVAELTNGNIVVAWTRANGATTEQWYRVYDSSGGTVKAATLLDTAGTRNLDPSILALDDGGFAIAYTDNGWGYGTDDITFAKLSSAGVFEFWTNVTAPDGTDNGSSDQQAEMTQLANGLVALSYQNNSFPDTDNITILVDPSDGSVVQGQVNTTGDQSVVDDISDVTISAMQNDRIAIFHGNITDSDINGAIYDLQRNSTSDGDSDEIIGIAGVDLMIGNAGDDTLIGAGGDDSLFGGFGEDSLAGGAGDDFLRSGPQNDWLGGGGGNDTLGGSIRHDKLFGGGDEDLLIGSNGNDGLYGNAGLDTLVGGNGRDTLNGGPGADRLNGGGGNNDTADYSDAGGSIWAQLSSNSGLAGDANGDVYIGIENVTGSAFQDTIEGNNSRNIFRGGDGDDSISGLGGNDIIMGQEGDDVLSGGAGNDQFWYRKGEGADLITDFNDGDVIRLLGFGSGFDSFAEVMAAASQIGANVFINMGNGNSITLQSTSLSELSADDFIF